MWSLVGACAVVLLSWWLTRPSETNADGAVPSDGVPGGAALLIAVPLLLVVLAPLVPAVLRTPTLVVDLHGIALRPLVLAKRTAWEDVAFVEPPSTWAGRRGIAVHRVDGKVVWLDRSLVDQPLGEVSQQIAWFCEDFGLDVTLRQAGEGEEASTDPPGPPGASAPEAGLGVLGVVWRMVR